MKIRLTNTLTRQKEDFVPADPERVTMYVCGSTVYNHPHIGNARPAVVFDVLFRLLRHALRRRRGALRLATTPTSTTRSSAPPPKRAWRIDVITDKFARIYREDMGALGVLDADVRAARHRACRRHDRADRKTASRRARPMPCASGVYFSVAADADYGKLSRRAQEDMQAGARAI